jgi:predicted outer membrane protein
MLRSTIRPERTRGTTRSPHGAVLVTVMAAVSLVGGCPLEEDRVEEDRALEEPFLAPPGDDPDLDNADEVADTARLMGRLQRLDRVVIEFGEYAKVMATAGEVRIYADRLVRDHERIAALVEDVARRLQIEPVEPAPPPAETQAEIDTIRRGLVRAGGREIDRRFLWIMIRVHRQAIDWLERERPMVHPELGETIDRILPILRQNETLGGRLLDELSEAA